MRKLLLAVIALCFAMTSFAQGNNQVYQDGKLWFRLKSDYKVNKSLNEDPNNLPIATIPFLPAITKNHVVTKLSRPFHAAKNSPELQRTYLLEFSDYSSVATIIAEFDATNSIDYVERVPMDYTDLTPNDPSYASMWHLATIGASSAWNFFSTGSTIKIAIVDNAVDRTHQDLSGNLWTNPGETPNNGVDDDGNGYIDDINGYDVADLDNNPNPPNNSFDHGTHCAGISSASTNNSVGIASIGYSCKLIAVKATNNSASPSSVTDGYDGIVYSVAAGADVISLSWGGTGSSTTAQNIITWASNQGCVIVAAAGNSNVNTMHYPAAYTECIAVAATTSSDAKAGFSNYGTWVDISAPGNNIYSTLPSNQYGNMSGTSMATPLVSGLCGLMLSLNPSLTPADVKNCLYSTATNINAQNPSYIGQLGAGRINANAAMNCISGTLNWPPNAMFTANVTTVTAGGSVTFTDQSVYNPTTWTWTFQGGTPATYVGQNPPAIVYNTPGTYSVSLTVSNGNGSDTQSNTNYITVTAASGCTTINLPAPGTWTPVNYYTGATVGQDGWINGMNVYLDKEKAMYFDASSSPYNQLVNVWVAFGRAYSANPAKIVNMKIYDGTSGSPGAQIGSTIGVNMGQIMADEAGNYYTEYSFVNTPVTLPASKKFFVSLDLTNLQWTSGVHDTLSIVSNTGGQTTPSVIWEKQANNTWYQYTTAGSWNLSASLYIHPFLTNANSVATFTQSATTICEGEQINFNGTGSTVEDTLLWYFPGATNPIISNNLLETVTYNTAGSYQAILYVVGGGCGLFDSAFVNITVNPNPAVTITANPANSTVCTGGTVNLTASGASSYVWSPATYLSSTTTAATVSTPTASITYNVQGTGANGCQTNVTIPVTVNAIPVASMIMSDTFICVNGSITYDGSNSTDVTSFAWSFPGGNPTSSTSSAPSVIYNTVGTFTAMLIVTNSCGTDTIMYNNVGVGCADIPEMQNQWSAFFNHEQNELQVNSPARTSSANVMVMNALGQVVYTMNVPAGSNMFIIDMNNMASGLYSLVVDGEQGYSMKFVKE
jgi:subtilisin family serine protease